MGMEYEELKKKSYQPAHTRETGSGKGKQNIFKVGLGLFLHKNLCCWCSLESPCVLGGNSNAHPQHRFL